MFCTHLTYKSQDFAQYDGIGNGEGLQDQNWKYGQLDYIGNIWEIEEKDGTFDAILCTEVLEHVPYPEQTIKEFSRLLKRGGVLLLTAPFCSIPHMEPYYYYSGFSKDFYFHCAQSYGLEIASIESNGNAFDFTAQELIRTTQFVENKISRFLFKVIVYSTIVPVLKCFSKWDKVTHKYLCFGYHVKMVKK